MLLQVFLLSLALLLLALLRYDVFAVAFPIPMPEKSSGLLGSLEGDLLHAFPNAGKIFRSLECYLLDSPMPENSGPWSQARSSSRGQTFMACMEACKMSHSEDCKTIPASGNAKGLLAGTRRVF